MIRRATAATASRRSRDACGVVPARQSKNDFAGVDLRHILGWRLPVAPPRRVPRSAVPRLPVLAPNRQSSSDCLTATSTGRSDQRTGSGGGVTSCGAVSPFIESCRNAMLGAASVPRRRSWISVQSSGGIMLCHSRFSSHSSLSYA